MCRGGGGNDKAEAERRHKEQMELQREQMRIQQEQFERNLEEQRKRFEAQQAAAQAQAPSVPEQIAEVAASATEIAPAPLTDPSVNPANQTTAAGAAAMQIGNAVAPLTQKAGAGRRKYRTDLLPAGGGSGSLMIPNT
tara:strand:- start:172 stop:585 length:414 start_codon:yes stop_codon:yes gene_type:complete